VVVGKENLMLEFYRLGLYFGRKWVDILLCTLSYIMSGVLRWGDRDILQPGDLTRGKKKRKIFKILFFFYL
jgi:hypothetical protein